MIFPTTYKGPRPLQLFMPHPDNKNQYVPVEITSGELLEQRHQAFWKSLLVKFPELKVENLDRMPREQLLGHDLPVIRDALTYERVFASFTEQVVKPTLEGSRNLTTQFKGRTERTPESITAVTVTPTTLNDRQWGYTSTKLDKYLICSTKPNTIHQTIRAVESFANSYLHHIVHDPRLTTTNTGADGYTIKITVVPITADICERDKFTNPCLSRQTIDTLLRGKQPIFEMDAVEPKDNIFPRELANLPVKSPRELLNYRLNVDINLLIKY